MKILSLNSTQYITAELAGAVATTEPDFVAVYADTAVADLTPTTVGGVLNSTTPVVVVDSPTTTVDREVKDVIIYNRDTASITLTLKFYDGAALRFLKTEIIQAGGSRDFNALFDPTGAPVLAGLSGMTFVASPGTIFSSGVSVSSGTAAATLGLVNQAANMVLAGPATGSATQPGFRALVPADLPNHSAALLTSGALNAIDVGTTTPAQGFFSALKLKIGGFFAIFTHANSADHTYTLPNYDGTLATVGGTETLTSKTLTSPTVNTPTISGGTIDNTPVGTTTRALGYFSALRLYISGKAAIFTHAFSADRTVTLPGDTDVTLVGTDTAQTLINKSIDASEINSGQLAVARGGTHLATLTAHGLLVGNGASDPTFVTPGAAQTFLESNGTDWIAKAPLDNLVILQDQKTANTQGGTFTAGSWQTRTLNTEVTDTGGLCTLSSNQFTLAAGTYQVIARAPGYRCARHQIRIYNVTGSTQLALGSVALSVATADYATVDSWIVGDTFTVAASQALELQDQCTTTRATDGFGVAGNITTEVYAQVFLRKIA